MSSFCSLSFAITSIANFSIQYNFQSIAVALLIMTTEECTADDDACRQGTQAGWVAAVVTADVFIGAMIGQLSMGYAGDLIGRNEAMVLTLSIALFGILGSALLSVGSPTAVYAIICLFRFILGIGVGGIYPLSAIKAAEDAAKQQQIDNKARDDKIRESMDSEFGKAPLINDGNAGPPKSSWKVRESAVGAFAAAKAFIWQCPGAMAPYFVGYVFASVPNMEVLLEWKLLLVLGAIPVMMVLYFSYIEMKEYRATLTRAQREAAKREQKQRKLDTQKHVSDALASPKYRNSLVATAGGWFLGDFISYGLFLSGGLIIADMKGSDDDNISTDSSIRYIASRQMICMSVAIPGIFATIGLLAFWTTKTVQMVSFGFLMVTSLIFACAYDPLMDSNNYHTLYALFCVLFFGLLGGVGVTTFVLSTEVYPAEIRSTFTGMSAAGGKFGAALGAALFAPVAQATSYPTVIGLCSFLSFVGIILSYVYIEDEKAEIKPFVTNGLNSSDGSTAVGNAGGYAPPVVSSLAGNKTTGGYRGGANGEDVHSPFAPMPARKY